MGDDTMDKKDAWLRQYTLSLIVGVSIIMLVGILANTEQGDTGVTGFVVVDQSTGISSTGQVTELYLISKDCLLSPAKLYASSNDKIHFEATVYDGTGRTHRISIPDLGIDIRVRGREVNYAEFYAPPGVYPIHDAYPCEAQGLRARAELIVR
ncbi:MAG: hypothetical protein ABIJ21_07150 [Nanoarchaeota archaeon]